MSRSRPRKSPAPAQAVRHRQAQGAGAADDEPESIEALRLELMRRIETLAGTPLRCRAPICRRRKVCADPAVRCRRDIVMPVMTPEQEANELAIVQRLIKQEIARREAMELGDGPSDRPSGDGDERKGRARLSRSGPHAMIERAGRKRGLA